MSHESDRQALIVKIILELIDELGVSHGEVLGHRRGEQIDRARLLCHHLVGQVYPFWSNIKIARFMNRSDAATIRHARKRHIKLCDTDPGFAEISNRYQEMIQS
jgi:hypothetical protein